MAKSIFGSTIPLKKKPYKRCASSEKSFIASFHFGINRFQWLRKSHKNRHRFVNTVKVWSYKWMWIAAQMTWWEMFEFRRKLSPCTPVYRNEWDISHVIFLRPLVFKIHHARSAGLTSTSRWAVHYKEHTSVQYIRTSSNETYLLS